MYTPLSRSIPVEGYTHASIPPKRDDKATVFLTITPSTRRIKNQLYNGGFPRKVLYQIRQIMSMISENNFAK